MLLTQPGAAAARTARAHDCSSHWAALSGLQYLYCIIWTALPSWRPCACELQHPSATPASTAPPLRLLLSSALSIPLNAPTAPPPPPCPLPTEQGPHIPGGVGAGAWADSPAAAGATGALLLLAGLAGWLGWGGGAGDGRCSFVPCPAYLRPLHDQLPQSLPTSLPPQHFYTYTAIIHTAPCTPFSTPGPHVLVCTRDPYALLHSLRPCHLMPCRRSCPTLRRLARPLWCSPSMRTPAPVSACLPATLPLRSCPC